MNIVDQTNSMIQENSLFDKEFLNYIKTAENEALLKINKYCRDVWTNYFKQSAMNFDKEFSSEEKIISPNGRLYLLSSAILLEP